MTASVQSTVNTVYPLVNPATLNLHRDLVPYRAVDYITLVGQSSDPEMLESFVINELKKIEPSLRVFYLYDQLKNIKTTNPLENARDEILLKHWNNPKLETKYLESRYNLLIAKPPYKPNTTSRLFMTPGEFAHQVFYAHFSRIIVFQGYDFKISRFDFKATLPEMEFKEYTYHRDTLLDFHSLLPLDLLEKNDEKGFECFSRFTSVCDVQFTELRSCFYVGL